MIQRRQDGSVDFDQLWQAYEKGFGGLNGKYSLDIDLTLALCKTRLDRCQPARVRVRSVYTALLSFINHCISRRLLYRVTTG